MPVTRRWLCACMLLGSLLATFHEPAQAASATYTVSVVPALPATETKRRWQPLLDQLSRDTGFTLHFRFYEDNEQFEEGLMRGEPDFAMIGPYQLWKVRPRYQPLLRDAAPMTGLVLVGKNSPVQSLSDLGGRTLAFPSGSDMTTTMVLTQSLKDPKIQPLLRPQRTHVNGVRGVMLGKLDAVISNSYSMKLIPPGLEQQLRVIYRTPPTPGPAFASAQHIPAEDALRMKAALLHLKATHPELLDSALMPNITEADLERDYSIFSTLYGNGTSHAAP